MTQLRKRSEIGKKKVAEPEHAPVVEHLAADLEHVTLTGQWPDEAIEAIAEDSFDEFAPDPEPTFHPPLTPDPRVLTAVMSRVDRKLAAGQLPNDMTAYPQPSKLAYPSPQISERHEGLRPGDKPAPVDRSPSKPRTEDAVEVENRVSESPDFNRLVETVLRELDLDAEYGELEAFLEIGDNRRDFATLMEEVDKADRRALRANAIWANAVIVYEGLKLDQREVDAHLWADAKKALEEEPGEAPEELVADGKKTKRKAAKKSLTNADVDAKIAELYPDEWRGGKMRLKRAELAVERAEAFSKRWAERTRSLQVMLTSCRK